MNDNFFKLIYNCPWVSNNVFDLFWSFFRSALSFLTWAMYGISIWVDDIHVFVVSNGLLLNQITISLYQRIFDHSPIFVGCGGYWGTPSDFSQQVSFFFSLFFHYLFIKERDINIHTIFLVSIWGV